MRCKVSLLFVALLLLHSLPAAVDDGDADLKDTPEELARMAVLKRWPDAQNIDAFEDLPEEEEVANGGEEAPPAEDLPEQMLPKDDASDWTVSTTFTVKDREFEVLTNDEGLIRYVYEEVPVDDAPVVVLKGARTAVTAGDFLYVDKVVNEHRQPPVVTYVVGVGERDVYVDDKGKALKVLTPPPAEEGMEEPREVEGAL